MNDLPFKWNMRLSKRAKRPRITLDKHGEVALVWPDKMPQKHALAMLKEHSAWVLKHLQKLPQQADQQVVRPQHISLTAVGLSLQVCYQATERKGISFEQGDDMLMLSGQVEDEALVRLALCTWIKQQGKRYLSPWLADQADGMGLAYSRVSIRLQKSRWGSCSAAKRINLNASLLFLSPKLVQHVLIHELCHLKHLNHSPSFWAEVARFDVDYVQNRKLLRQQSGTVPLWLTRDFCSA